MSFLTKHNNGLKYLFRATLTAFTFCFTFSLATAQLTNGVFDPTKVMVAKDKVKQVQTIEQNISIAKEFNRTLGTPSHPKPNIPVSENTPSMNEARNSVGPPRYGPEPVSVPSFDLPPDVEQRNQARARKRRDRETPTVVANKIENPPPREEPMVSANPVSIRGVVPTFDTPDPPLEAPEMEFADLPKVEKRGFFDRFYRSKQTTPDDINMTSPEDGSPQLPPSEANVSMNGELDVINQGSDLASVQENEGDIILPTNSSSPDMGLPSSSGARSGFLSMFSKSTRKSFDVPDRPIPISIGSGNTGNPYSSDSFQAAPGYAPLFDDPANRDQLRDMTEPGSLPFADGIAERHSQKPIEDVSQYLIIKNETGFEPFKHGTEEVDKANAFDLYPGSTIKDLGITGLKRIVQIDSGETGLIAKFSARQLSVSEELVMSNGLTKGRPWYSILDTEAEIDEFASSLSSKPMAGPRPQRPWESEKAKSPGNGKPDSDMSQYYIVKKNGVTFAPFAYGGQEIDLSSSFEIPAGAIVKVISTPGSNHVVQTDSGEGGVIATDGLRPLNESEKASLAGGITKGRPWYSILDTEADVTPFSVARAPTTSETSKPLMGIEAPKPPVGPVAIAPPKVIVKKPESDTSQYYVVKNDGVLFEPFRYGSQEVDTDSSFEMYSGAVIKVLSTVDGKHIVQTDSGENGVIAVDGLRSLKDNEKELMTAGIGKGKAWYSILDTAPSE